MQLAVALVGAAISLLPTGCNDRGGATSIDAPNEVAQKNQREELGKQLLASGSDMLNNLDHFVEGGSDFREASTEDAVRQTVRRLNEGLAFTSGDETQKPLLTEDDGKVLREIVWLRDAARFAVGDATDPLQRAERLFDWTIRNIQLIPDDAPAEQRLPLLPWHVLVFGRGTALDRAWLFQLLARQQGLDVVLLAYPDVSDKDLAATDGKRWWCAALALEGAATGGKPAGLYLFDTRWGTPIPGPDGQGVATLAQAAADDKLLRALDIDAKHPYPVKSADIQKVVALVETSSPYVAERFAKLEAALAGEDKLALSVNRKAVAAKVEKLPHVARVQDWPLRDARFTASREKANYEALSKQLLAFSRRPRDLATGRVGTPPLWRARVRHVSGKYYENMDETDPALRRPMIVRWYQMARPAESDLGSLQLDTLNWEQLHRMKQHATYWLGLASYDLGNYDTAATFFGLVFKDDANGGWTAGARYNLGRTYEAEAAAAKDPAQKKAMLAKAVETYRATFLGLPPDAECLYRALSVEARRETTK
ncbi:MAG: hypothetical protein C0483_01110 [Pirellula sp.]|nr:hypothetical protein [Pirellula sp.]